VDALRAALLGRDFEGLVSMLHPDVAFHSDPGNDAGEVRGAGVWARQALVILARRRWVVAAMVNGSFGAILAPYRRLARALTFTIVNGKIARIEEIANP
jgi:RNA polymerase sigma-70 factor (ECF subfamily)